MESFGWTADWPLSGARLEIWTLSSRVVLAKPERPPFQPETLGDVHHISEWLAREAGRGCALANAAVELPDNDHPARRVVREHKSAVRQRLADLCRDAGLNDPDGLAEEVFLLCEGARIASQSLGSDAPLTRLPVLPKDTAEEHSPPRHAPRARRDRRR